MDKRKKSVKTTRRKFVSGAGIIVAGLALKTPKLICSRRSDGTWPIFT